MVQRRKCRRFFRLSPSAIQRPHAIQELAHPFDPVRVPRHRLIERPKKQLVHTKHIRSVVHDHVIGIHHIPLGFGHLRPSYREHQSMRATFGVWLRAACLGDKTTIMQELIPKTRIQQVECRVFHPTVIEIHGKPPVHRFIARKRFGVFWVNIPQKVPARSRPVRHRVGLALGRTATRRTRGLDPITHRRKR